MSSAEIANADALSFRRKARPEESGKVVAYPQTGVHNIPDRPPTRGGTVYDQFHKTQVTLADVDESANKFKKSKEEMFEMQLQLKYGSPLVSECFAWGHKIEWATTSRPEGLERGIIKYSKLSY